VKTVAFVVGLVIFAVGAIGIFVPSSLVWISKVFAGPVEWYALAVIRVSFGVLLLFVAKASRFPRTLRVIAFIPIVTSLAIPFVGVDRARATVDLWSLQGSGLIRLSAVPVLVLGGFVAYACAPARRAA
jgi:hypothetical protein